MRRLSCLFPLTLAAIMASGAPAVARVTASDASATHAYLEARVVLRRAALAAQPDEREMLNSFFARDLGLVARAREYGPALGEYLTSAP